MSQSNSKPWGERAADVLARLAVEVLDNERAATGVDEWDESDPRCYLYNAAYAWIDGDTGTIADYEPAPAEYDEWLRSYDGRTAVR